MPAKAVRREKRIGGDLKSRRLRRKGTLRLHVTYTKNRVLNASGTAKPTLFLHESTLFRPENRDFGLHRHFTYTFLHQLALRVITAKIAGNVAEVLSDRPTSDCPAIVPGRTRRLSSDPPTFRPRTIAPSIFRTPGRPPGELPDICVHPCSSVG